MANSTTWTALLELNAKLNSNVSSSFKSLNSMMSRLARHSVEVTKTLTGMFLGFEAFKGVSAILADATKKAWEFDKSWARIQASVMSGSSGREKANPEELAKQFKYLKDNVFTQQVARGANPEFLSEIFQQMTQGGLTAKDISMLSPMITDRMLVQQVDTMEKAHEFGRSLTRGLIKNNPLHFTRSDQFFGGMDEKQVKLMFKGLGVLDRIKVLIPFMTKQFGGMAEAIMKTDEGAMRLGQNFAWLYETGIGEVLKGIQVDFMRFWDWLAPRFYPIFMSWMEQARRFAHTVENVLHSAFEVVLDWWMHNGQTILMWWEFQFVPRFNHIITNIGNAINNLNNSKLGKFGDWLGHVLKLDQLQTYLDGVTNLLKGIQNYTKFLENPFAAMDKARDFLKDALSQLWDLMVIKGQDALTRLTPAVTAFVALFKPITDSVQWAAKLQNGAQKDAGVALDSGSFIAKMLLGIPEGKEWYGDKAGADVQGAVQGVTKTFMALLGLPPLQQATEKVTPKILSMSEAVDRVSTALMGDAAILSMMPIPGVAGSGGGIGGIGSMEQYTEYGGGVVGDRPGEKTYDKDSYNGVGHIHGVEHSLQTGMSTAMHPEYAESHYHVKPGGLYRSDKDGKMHRWDDTTGARAGNNEDFYKGKDGSDGHSGASITNNFFGLSDRQMADKLKNTIHDSLRTSYDV